MGRHPFFDLTQKMRNLIGGRMHEYLRIQKPRRPEDLLNNLVTAFLRFKRSGRGGNKNGPRPALLEFLKTQWPIIQGAGQPETVLNQHFFSAVVARPHSFQLRNSGVRFIDKQQEIPGEIVNQRIRARPGRQAGQVPRIILDAAAIAHLLHHFDIVHRPGRKPLGFQQLTFAAQLGQAFVQLCFDALNGRTDPLTGHYVVLSRIDENLLFHSQRFGRYRVDVADLLYFVAEKLDADAEGFVGRMQLHDVAADPESTSLEIDVISRILDVRQSAEQLISIIALSGADGHNAGLVVLGRAKPEDTGDGCDDDTIVSR